jgi:hypothetical protein
MKQLKDISSALLQQQPGQGLSENYDSVNVEVSFEEIDIQVRRITKFLSREFTEADYQEAVRKAKDKKYGDYITAEYFRRLNTPMQAVKVTAAQYGIQIIDAAKRGLFTGGKTFAIDFIIDQDNQRVFDLLTWYFTSDARFTEAGYNLEKGLLIYGVTGCGKTTLVRMCKQNPVQPFTVVSAREIAMGYSEYGNEIIRRYSRMPAGEMNMSKKPIGVCFDDLGAENERSHYKDTLNVMAEILLGRYDNVPFAMTHITTNLSAEDMRLVYGAKVTSRLREMMNIIDYAETAKDRR